MSEARSEKRRRISTAMTCTFAEWIGVGNLERSDGSRRPCPRAHGAFPSEARPGVIRITGGPRPPRNLRYLTWEGL